MASVKLTNGRALANAQFLHRDHLDSVRAITDSTGAVVERAVYKPFGEQTEWLSASQPAPETKGWIGERFDADAGLQYLNARYYDPALGMFIQPDWFDVMQAGVGTNRFSYSFNDPINLADPSGNDVIFVNGTSGNDEWWTDDPYDSYDMYPQAQAAFPGQSIWGTGSRGMANTHQARQEAANLLSGTINSILGINPFAEINVIAYSHGGNVVKEYSQRADARPITNAITLGTPQRLQEPPSWAKNSPAYQMNREMVGNYVNVYSNNDFVQTQGGRDGPRIIVGAKVPTAGRIDPSADVNIDASTFNGEKVRHVTLGNGPMWDRPTINSGGVFGQYVSPYLPGGY